MFKKNFLRIVLNFFFFKILCYRAIFLYFVLYLPQRDLILLYIIVHKTCNSWCSCQNTGRYQPPSENAFQMAFQITDLSELKSKACQVIVSEILLTPHKTDRTDQYKDTTTFFFFSTCRISADK